MDGSSSATTSRLQKLAELRLDVQGGRAVREDDLLYLSSLLSDSELADDSPYRRSLILALETVCRRLWFTSNSASPLLDEATTKFVLVVLQKIGLEVQRLQFGEHDRWFGGVTPLRSSSSSGRRNADKARLFSIIAICLALSLSASESDAFVEKGRVVESLIFLYSSSTHLARDLLNSDDRFLYTTSALLALKSKLCNLSTVSPRQVTLAAFREIRFDAKVLLDWIDGDELGLDTVTALAECLAEDRARWESAAAPDASLPPSAKRPRISCSEAGDDEYSTTWLVEKRPCSDDDVVVTLRVPYLDGKEKTFRFSKKPAISTRHRTPLPQPSPDDFLALEEMMIELKLELNKRILAFEGPMKDVERLRHALSLFLEDGSAEDCSEDAEDSVYSDAD